jgi:arsenate reductase
MSTTKPTVLILCTGNSCRSHLAEGILRAVAGDILDVQSAGSKPMGYVHPLAIAAMKEIDIDISGHRSKPLSEFIDRKIETVITVCGNADAACPIFPGQVNRHHWPFEDPAQVTGTEAERLAVFRRVRNEIRRTFTAYADGRIHAMEGRESKVECARSHRVLRKQLANEHGAIGSTAGPPSLDSRLHESGLGQLRRLKQTTHP